MCVTHEPSKREARLGVAALEGALLIGVGAPGLA